MIEGLGRLKSKDDVYDEISFLPPYNRATELLLDPVARLHSIGAISQIVKPLPTHFSLANAISITLRDGLLKRDPLRPNAKRLMHELPETAIRVSECYTNRLKTPAPAILVCGLSGSGKGTAIESILNGYVQAQWHESYEGASLQIAQVTWLKLDCSFDASLKGLALSLFAAMDEILGTTYHAEFERARLTIDALLIHWQQIAVKHRLGILWIDEIQCLLTSGPDEARKVLNFFLKVSNLTGIAIIFSGTYSSVRLFSSTLQNARRICTGGYFELEVCKSATDPVWAQLLAPAFWRYQWVEQPAELDEPITQKLFQLTQALPALLELLCKMSQKAAIELGRKTVDADFLQLVFDQLMVPLHAAVAALRSRKKDRLRRFEDLMPTKAVLMEMAAAPSRMSAERALDYLLTKEGPAQQGDSSPSVNRGESANGAGAEGAGQAAAVTPNRDGTPNGKPQTATPPRPVNASANERLKRLRNAGAEVPH